MKKRLSILNQSGQGLTEYLILLILVAVGAIGATKMLGTAVSTRLKDAKEQINALSDSIPQSKQSKKSRGKEKTDDGGGLFGGLFSD